MDENKDGFRNNSADLDSYSYHEALDRAYIQLVNLESALGEHPVIIQEPEVSDLYDKAVESLADLYQKLGDIKFANCEVKNE